MKTEIIVFILFLLALPQLAAASAQNLTYDNPTNQVNISYDALNRILTKNTTSINITYAYDKDYEGTLANVSFSNSTFKYEYDDKLRVTKETRTIDGIVFEKKNYYDSMDRLVKQTLNPGITTDYNYNNQSKLSRVIDFINNTFHNAFDNPLNRTYANTRVTEFSYDSQNARLAQIKTGSIQNLTYYYDKVGNIIAIDDRANGRTYNMTYDFLDRLVNATIGPYSFIYSYNPLGNILAIGKDYYNTTKFIYGNYPTHAPIQIITKDSGTDVSGSFPLYSTNKSRAIQFFISNEKNSTLANANWSIDFGNLIANSTIAFNVTTNESILVVAENNYTNAGEYRINISSSSSGNLTDYENLTVRFGVMINKLTLKALNASNATFELDIFNSMNSTSQNVNWKCDSVSGGPFTLSAFSNRLESFSINYTSLGKKLLTCNTTSADGNHNRTIDFNLRGIEIEDINITATTVDSRLVTFNLTNYYWQAPITWYIASDGQTFTNSVTLGTNQSRTISQNITYTTDGKKAISINASSDNVVGRRNETVDIKSIGIYDYDVYILNNSNKLMTFAAQNYWPQNQRISWNITEPLITSNAISNLTESEPLIVFIENNYTDQGRKIPKITAYNNSRLDSFVGNFLVKMVEITGNLVLAESQNSTVQFITAVNNIGQRLFSWTFNTTKESIPSTQDITLNNSEKVLIVIETNYSSRGVYPTNVTVNSTGYNDTASGVSLV